MLVLEIVIEVYSSSVVEHEHDYEESAVRILNWQPAPH